MYSPFTGLNNDMLDDVKTFDFDTGNLIKCFLHRLNKPICLVAHNGFRFDYPILKRQLSENVSWIPFLEILLIKIQSGTIVACDTSKYKLKCVVYT